MHPGRLRSVLRTLALLVLVINALAPVAGQATPSPGVRSDRVIEQELDTRDLPSSIDVVSLERWTLAPGSGPFTIPGTSLLHVESGELTAHEYTTVRVYLDPATPGPIHVDDVFETSASYRPGETLAVLAWIDTWVDIENPGSTPVSGLAISLRDEHDTFPSGNGLLVTPLVEITEMPGLRVSGISLDRLTFDAGAEDVIEVPDAAACVVSIEDGVLNVQPSGPTMQASALDGTIPREGMMERVPGEHFNLFTGDWLLSGPGTIAVRNVERGSHTVALVLTLASSDQTGTDGCALR